MKYQWLLRLTTEEFEVLKNGLKQYFRFDVRGENAIQYFPDCLTLQVECSNNGNFDRISAYINGFCCLKQYCRV